MAQILCCAFQEPLSAKRVPTRPETSHLVVLTLPSRLAKLFQHNPTPLIVKCSTAKKLIRSTCPNSSQKNKCAGAPSITLPRGDQLQSRRGVHRPDPGEFPCDNARQHECRAGFEPIDNPFDLPNQQRGIKVRADQVEPGLSAHRPAAEVLAKDPEPSPDTVARGVCLGGANRIGVDVKRVDGAITQFRGRNGDNSGAGADVEQRLRLPEIPARHHLFQTKGCGRVFSGAETQARVNYNDGLTGARTTTTPTRFDQQRVANLQRFEMSLP